MPTCTARLWISVCCAICFHWHLMEENGETTCDSSGQVIEVKNEELYLMWDGPISRHSLYDLDWVSQMFLYPSSSISIFLAGYLILHLFVNLSKCGVLGSYNWVNFRKDQTHILLERREIIQSISCGQCWWLIFEIQLTTLIFVGSPLLVIITNAT